MTFESSYPENGVSHGDTMALTTALVAKETYRNVERLTSLLTNVR